jgi:hypothetical protein
LIRRTPNLVEEIDALEAKLEARLAEFIDEDKVQHPTLPREVIRNLLLRGA